LIDVSQSESLPFSNEGHTRMTQYPPTGPGYPNPGMMRPHRGTMILVFGILSWVVCIIFGFVAWNMGNSDLAEMDAGRMDPEGRGLTQAGKILGMIHAILSYARLRWWCWYSSAWRCLLPWALPLRDRKPNHGI